MNNVPGYPDTEKLAGKTILITGGTGFIGSPLVQALSPHCDVVVLSRDKKIKGIRTIHADISNLSDLVNSAEKTDIDLVFHVAGNTVTPSHTRDIDHFSINALGTKNLLELCLKKDVEQMIYSSSMEVYGNPLSLPVSETDPKIPGSYYGMSKWTGEHYCQEFRKQYGLNTTILRYSYVYGPNLPDFRVISRFIRNALEERPLVLHNSGRSTTDYVFVKDVVSSNILAASHKNAINQDFNIGSGTETSVEDLAYEITEITGRGTVQHLPRDQERAPRFVFDISKAKKALDFVPGYSLHEGLKEQIQYMINAKQ